MTEFSAVKTLLVKKGLFSIFQRNMNGPWKWEKLSEQKPYRKHKKYTTIHMCISNSVYVLVGVDLLSVVVRTIGWFNLTS